MFNRLFFLIICIGLFLNQLGRIQVGNGIAFTLLDVSVFLFYIYTLVLHWAVFLQRVSSLPKTLYIFFAIFIVSWLWNFHNYTFLQNVVSSLYIFRFLLYLSIFITVPIVFDLKKASDKLFIILSLTLTGFLLLAAGIIQYSYYPNLRNLYYLGWDEHMYRLFSTFLDPNFAGTFFVLFFLFLCGLYFIAKEKVVRLLLLLGIGMSLIVIFLTFSRSAIIMLLVSSVFFFSLTRKFLYIFVVLVVLVISYVVVSPKLSVENTNFFRIASTEARLNSAEIALQVIQKNPIIGVGFDAYRYAQEKYGFKTEYTSLGMISHADASTDNSLLFVWATLGSAGLISYIMLQLEILVRIVRRVKQNNILAVVVLSSLIGLDIDCLFINSLFYPSILLWLGVIGGVTDYI